RNEANNTWLPARPLRHVRRPAQEPQPPPRAKTRILASSFPPARNVGPDFSRAARISHDGHAVKTMRINVPDTLVLTSTFLGAMAIHGSCRASGRVVDSE